MPLTVMGSRRSLIVDSGALAYLQSTPAFLYPDFLTPPYFSDALAAAIPGARLGKLPRGGHACSEVMVEEFNRDVLTFIDEHCQGQRVGGHRSRPSPKPVS